MSPEELAAELERSPAVAGLRLLVLHGSRARGDQRGGSDWDFGVLVEQPESVDLAALVVALSTTLGTDAVDVVDLDRTSALLRFRAARDGVAIVERPAGEFLRFRERAVQFWCDVGPVIRAAQADVLAGLG